jgi:hypothetical protein
MGFGPVVIVNSGDDNYVGVYHSGLMETGVVGEKERVRSELGRWKAPEILKEEEFIETEKSGVFTMGMMICTILIRKKLFHKDTDEIALEKITKGERPDMSGLGKRKCEFILILRKS